jgi:membrane protein implicated in regulation of membrane protease activity
MLTDILIALLITVAAVILGLTVHPVLFFLIALALIYVVTRFSARGRTGTYHRRL